MPGKNYPNIGRNKFDSSSYGSILLDKHQSEQQLPLSYQKAEVQPDQARNNGFIRSSAQKVAKEGKIMSGMSNLNVGTDKYDLSGLIEKYRAYENRQLDIIKTNQLSTQTKISAYGTLASAVNTLEEAAAKLGEASTFGALKTTVSGDSFTATAESNANVGRYSIQVNALATSQVLRADGINSRKTPIGMGGVIDITLDDGSIHSLDVSENTSLEGIVGAINKRDDLGVHAAIIADGQGKYHLMLTAQATGNKGAVTEVTVKGGNTDLADLLNYDFMDPSVSKLTEVVAASDAELEINGLSVVSSSNTVTEALDGVTLTLNKESTQAETLSFVKDTVPAAKAIREFVQAYNELQSAIYGLTSYNGKKNQASVLTADRTVQSIQRTLANALRTFASEGTLRSMGDLGIVTDLDTKPIDGRLIFKPNEKGEDLLLKGLREHPKDVERIFAGPNGVANAIDSAMKAILGDGKSSGSLDVSIQGLEKTLEKQEKTLEMTQERIDQKMRVEEKKMLALSKQLVGFESTQNFLTNQFKQSSKS